MDQNSSGPSSRKHYTPEEKFKIIKDHFTQKIPVSDILKKNGISSANFYRWQDEFFSGALDRLKNGKQQASSTELRQIEDLTKQNERFKTVIAEMSHEVVTLKKTLGE